MKTTFAIIERVLNREDVSVQEVPTFTSFAEATPFLVEVGKAAREMVNGNPDSFFCTNAMREIESNYREARKADCGFNVYTQAAYAFGWLKKIVSFC